MQRTSSPVEQQQPPTCSEAQLGHLSELLARLYRLWLGLVFVLLAFGLVLDVAEDARLEDATVPLPALPGRLMEGDPAAFESLALLIVTLGPIIGVVTMLAYCMFRGDRRTALLALLVLLVVAALPIARAIGGR